MAAPKKKVMTQAAKKSTNKLISLRISEETLQDLRRIADRKGDVGYQQLIKTYIQGGLKEEKLPAVSMPPKPLSLSAAPAKVKKTKLKSRGSDQKSRDAQAMEVIHEDIEALAEALRDYWPYFAGKRFLITGAFGFLGRYMVHLLHYLNENVLGKEKTKALLLDNFVTGYEQKIISDENLEFIRHDVIKSFETEEEIHYIIHAAGIASPAYYTKFPIETMDVGTVGTRHMLELARQKNVESFIFMSSSEVYGDPDPKHIPTKEDYYGNVSITGPRACYDESKRFGETMCQAYWQVYGVPVKMIRPFNVYGPGIRPDDYRVLPNFIEHALRKEPLPVHGAGHNTRSFCYINDAIEAIFRVLFSSHHGEPFNIGNPIPEISVRDLAKKVAETMPFKVDVVFIDPPHAVYANSDPKRRCPDITKLQQATGFKPRYSLERGLERTIQWFSQL